MVVIASDEDLQSAFEWVDFLCPERDFLSVDGQIEETIDLLRLLASDYELVSRRRVLPEIIQSRMCWCEDFGCEHTWCWKA